MDTTITKPVKEILADEKRTLEGMLGTSLAADQQVFVLAYTPGAIPSDDARENARRGIEAILATNQGFAKDQDVAASEADDAIAEAMRQTRRRA